MNETNSVFVALLFILRCLVPLLILLGISYLLRRLGLVVVEDPEPPEEDDEGQDDENPQTTRSQST